MADDGHNERLCMWCKRQNHPMDLDAHQLCAPCRERRILEERMMSAVIAEAAGVTVERVQGAADEYRLHKLAHHHRMARLKEERTR